MNSRPKILIADDDNDLRDLLQCRCEQMGLQVFTADDVLNALNTAREHRPEVICMDVEMPGGNGLAACEMLANDDQLANIPLIIITGRTETDVERRCHSLAAYYVPKATDTWSRLKPLLIELLDLTDSSTDSSTSNKDMNINADMHTSNADRTVGDLLDTVFSLIGSGEQIVQECEPKPWVLCIDDDIDFSEGLGRRLEASGIGVVNAFEGSDGFRAASKYPPDAIILDYTMPDGSGDNVLRRLKQSVTTRSIPVIVLTGHTEPEIRMRMTNLGASAFYTKPVDFSVLVEDLLDNISNAREKVASEVIPDIAARIDVADPKDAAPSFGSNVTSSNVPSDNQPLRGNVLIADDDRDLLNALTLRCERIGLSVVTAEDCMTALSTSEFVDLDLAILDVDMPAGNGLATCEMMAHNSALRGMPVIVLTGKCDPATQRRCEQLHAHYVLKSPSQWATLEPLIRKLLAGELASSS
ncbi:MAG: response regulator [Planctomycetales bacterium]|nr:response regulator [Planctomycetales bacterium]